MGSLRSASWLPYVPFLLHQVADGNDVVADAFIRPTFRGIPPEIDNTAAWASLWCYSEGRFADRAGVEADRAAHPRLVDPEARDLVPALCAAWHDPLTDRVDRTPVTSDVPTLLLSGQFDPATPPQLAELAAETLSRSYSFVVPMAGHGVGVDTGCVRDLIRVFLNEPDENPSSVCFPIADRDRTEFRTIFLNRGMRMQTTDRIDSTGAVKVRVLAYGMLVTLLMHLSTLAAWLSSATIRRIRPVVGSAPPRVTRARMTAAAVIVISIGFCWAVRATEEGLLFIVLELAFLLWFPNWLFSLLLNVFLAPDALRLLSDPLVSNFGYYAWVRPLFVIPYLTAGATVYVLYLAFRSWRERWWSRLGRVHYSIVAITLAWYPFQLLYWGFIP